MRLRLWLACDLAPDVADDATEPGAQEAQFPMVAVELLGVSVTSRHHGGSLGDAQIGLPQPHPVLLGQAVEPLDRSVQQFGVGREGDGLGLHRGVDRDPRQIARAQRATLMGDPQALGQRAAPACRRAASANGSGRSARAGSRAGRTPRR